MSVLDRLKAHGNPEPPHQPASPAPPENPKSQTPSLLKPKTPVTPEDENEPEGGYDPTRLDEPRTVEHLGLRRDFLQPHVLKTVSVLDTFTATEAAERLCLPLKLTTELIEEWRDLKCLEVLSSTSYTDTSRRYTMTTAGRSRAHEYMRLSAYVGPVPIPVNTYRDIVIQQTVLDARVNMESLRSALSHLVLNENLMKPLGPAVNSGRTIFLYGPPGNGKTAIAVALASLLGGAVAIPRAVEIDGFVMRLFDPSVHHLKGTQPADRRWVRCHRPAVLAGGELTLDTMELHLDPASNTYEAPPHVKSNNGVFILDDFGRQLVRPRDLLNRWIVPLENRVDFLTLHTGSKVRIPFDQLVIFNTNLEPRELLDDAFMRRLRHKVYVGPLGLDEFKTAFERACENKSIPFRADVFETLVKEIYDRRNIPFTGCHPRDLLDHLTDIAKFEERSIEMNQELLIRACESYFAQVDRPDSGR